MTHPADDPSALRRRIEQLERELAQTRATSEAIGRIIGSIDHHLYINEVLPDGGRRNVYSGPGRERLLGGSPPDGDWGRAWVDAVHPEDRLAYAQHTARYRRGEPSEVDYRIVGFDGVIRWIRGGGWPRRDGGRLLVEGIVRDATAEVMVEAQLREASRTDALTRIFNRRHFSEVLDAELVRSREEGHTPGLLLLDIDYFKLVNDTYGHQAGDVVLVEVAARLRDALRRFDCLARWGGEEFIVLVPAIGGELELVEAAEGLRRAIGTRPFAVGDQRLTITVSIGAVLIEPDVPFEHVVDRADRALYSAKRLGRDRVRCFSELNAVDLAAEEPESVRLAQALALSASVREGMPELHSEQVADLAGELAENLGLGGDAVLRCRLGGWLHDVGKVAIPDRILTKRGPLEDAEWSVMQAHSEIGEQIVRRVAGLSIAADAVRHHHERWDGSGYPDGLAGDDIPVVARVVAVADAYSAMTSDRAYAPPATREAALAELRACAGKQHDPAIVTALAHALDEHARRFAARLEPRRAA